VNKTPPQEYAIQFSNGFNDAAASKYWRTQESVVHVKIKAKSSATYGSGAIIATLPVGFRPRRQESDIGKYDMAGTGNNIAQINFETNGDIRMYPTDTGISSVAIVINTAFLATQ